MSRKHILGILLLGAFVPLSMAASGNADVPAFLNIVPGVTTKAEVDLTFGDPLKKPAADGDEFEYSPPVEATIFERIVIAYNRDTKQVARLDAYFKTPHSAGSVRTEMQLGKRILSLDRPAGGVEEIYYPKCHALIFNSKTAAAPVAGVSYFSTRYLADVFVARAENYLRSKQYTEAGDEADKAVVVDPDYARGYLAQGWYYQSQKNYDEAITRFLAAANARYSSLSKGQAHSELGLMYWKQKNLLDKAQAEFQQAVGTAPDYYFTHLAYGRFLRARKQEDQALTELTRGVELDPKGQDTRLELASFLYEKKDFALAIPHYEWLSQWVESEAASDRDAGFRSRIHFEYAYALAEAGKQDRAIDAYQLALKRNPQYAAALNNIGVLYRKQKDPSKAEEFFRSGLKVDSKHFLLNRNLAEALLEKGLAEEAGRQAEFTLTLKPDDAWTMIDVARCWAVRGKKKQALEWIGKAAAAGYRDAGQLANDSYLESLRSNGDFKKILLGMR